MNLDVVSSLKTVIIKSNNKDKPSNSRSSDDSFLKSLNKFLEKDNLKNNRDLRKTRSDSQETRKDKKDNNKEDSFNYLGVLNANPLVMNNYPHETSLNTENGLEAVINSQLGLEALSEETFNEEIINFGLETDRELQNLNLLEEEPETIQNFNLEEAKLNLDKALGKEVSIKDKNVVELEGLVDKTINGTKAANLEGKESSIKPEIVADLEEMVSKEDLIKPIEETAKGFNIENLDAKVSGAAETLIKSDTGVNLGEVDDGNVEVESLDLDDLLEKPVKLDGAEEEIEEVSSKTEQTQKNIETNFMLDRIQSSFSNLQEVENSISPQNLQNIQDTMIDFMKVSKEGDASVMKVRLYPEELGSIDISLKFQNGKLMADIIVQSESIKEMFLNGTNLLNKNLVEQNIPIKNINVTVNENLNSFENQGGEARHGEGRESHAGRNLNKSNVGSGNIKQNPIDDIRIDKINKTNKGLNILV